MVKLLEFLARHTACHLFRSSHLKYSYIIFKLLSFNFILMYLPTKRHASKDHEERTIFDVGEIYFFCNRLNK